MRRISIFSIVKRLFLKIVILLILTIGLSVNFTVAQDSDDDSPIKINTLLLNIPVTVTDKSGRHIAGLKKEDFTIYENGEKQNIEFFLDDEAPMNVAILIDTSGSTRTVINEIQGAAKDFIKIFRPEDKGIIVSFDYQTIFLSNLTNDQKQLKNGIDHAYIADRGGSDLHDAIYGVIKNYFAKVKGRKAIIALTDGMVSGRVITNQQILNILQLSNTLFYPIIFKAPFSPFMNNRTAINRIPNAFDPLKLLADETAGRFYEKDAKNLKEAFQSIAEELKKQYLIGYYPQRSGKDLTIRVEVNRKDLILQAKNSRAFKKAN